METITIILYVVNPLLFITNTILYYKADLANNPVDELFLLGLVANAVAFINVELAGFVFVTNMCFLIIIHPSYIESRNKSIQRKNRQDKIIDDKLRLKLLSDPIEIYKRELSNEN